MTNLPVDKVLAILAQTRPDGTRVWSLNRLYSVLGHDRVEGLVSVPLGLTDIDPAHVVETTYTDARLGEHADFELSALAAYTMVLPISASGTNEAAAAEAVRFFARELSGQEHPLPDRGNAPEFGRSKPAPEPDTLLVTDYLTQQVGDAEWAHRYASSFGKKVKQMYLDMRGTLPDTVERELEDGRLVPVCRYTESDREVMDSAWSRF